MRSGRCLFGPPLMMVTLLMRHAVGLVGRKLGNRAFIIGRKDERGAPMSLGYAGHARLEVEDDEIAIYSYTGEN